MSPTRRIAVAWAHLRAYSDGTAEAAIIHLDGGQRLLVICCTLYGRKAATTLRLGRGAADLHRIAVWLEHQEEEASRIAMRWLFHGMPEAPTTCPQVLH